MKLPSIVLWLPIKITWLYLETQCNCLRALRDSAIVLFYLEFHPNAQSGTQELEHGGVRSVQNDSKLFASWAIVVPSPVDLCVFACSQDTDLNNKFKVWCCEINWHASLRMITELRRRKCRSSLVHWIMTMIFHFSTFRARMWRRSCCACIWVNFSQCVRACPSMGKACWKDSKKAREHVTVNISVWNKRLSRRHWICVWCMCVCYQGTYSDALI